MAAVFLVVVGCFIVFLAAGRRVLRVLLPGVLLIGTRCYCWRCRGQGEKVPVVVIVRVRLFIFACSAVLLLLRAEAKAAIVLLLLVLRLSAWSLGPVCWFIFLTLYVACRVPVSGISIFISELSFYEEKKEKALPPGVTALRRCE